MRVFSGVLVLFAVAGNPASEACQLAQPAENHDEAAGGNTLLTATVVDADTGEPIDTFTALPGVGRLKFFDFRWQWQPHQIHEFKNGQLQWPPPGNRAYTQDQALRIEAEGYLPYETPTMRQPNEGESRPRSPRPEDQPPEPAPPLAVRPGEPASLVIRLKRDAGISGRVVDAEGEPVAGATVAIGMGNFRNIHLRNGEIYFWPKPKPNEGLRDRWVRPRHTKTDQQGRFTLPSEIQNAKIAAAHPAGFAVTSYDEFPQSGVLKLQAWGRIEGRAIWNGKPAEGEKIYLFATYQVVSTDTDGEGRFSFDKVPPGEVGLGRSSAPPGDWNVIATNPRGRVDVPPGETAKCVLGGRGRPIVGRVVGYEDWRKVRVSVHLALTWPSRSFRERDDPTLPAFSGYISSAYYRHYDKAPFGIEADGSFRLDDVAAEQYSIVVTERDADTVVNQGQSGFRIKLMPTGESDEPQDVGTIKISPHERVTRRKIEPRRPLTSEQMATIKDDVVDVESLFDETTTKNR